MYIKTIVLEGFKSYGQRTEITGFDEEFNAITGLNGSGKSNILDAICFVLGISNLTHVRANSLQDLIYKSGQAGINKATVSITFDNRNPAQCPHGFENFKEITITRQTIMGGKNKYLINGSNVLNKKVQDLFCSIQLNVNNPHFLIMQGKITKVLNMKPPEILAMVEEAAGTRMYETKRLQAQKTIEKKEAKLSELRAIIVEEIAPKLNKLKEERAQYLEYQRIEKQLDYYMGLYQVWQYYESQKETKKAQIAYEAGEKRVSSIHDVIKSNENQIKNLEKEIEDFTRNNAVEGHEKLEAAEEELKKRETVEANSNASLKATKENLASEEKKKKTLEKNLKDDRNAVQTKEQELTKVQSLFEGLKNKDAKDTEALALAQKKYEALSAGMEVNDDGQAQTLQAQLMAAKKEAAQAKTESQQATMRLNFCQSQLQEKQKDAGANSAEYEADKRNLAKLEREVAALEKKLGALNFSEERMLELRERRRRLTHEIGGLRERVENFEAQRPYTQVRYRDPETNFNRKSVHGVVCRLVKVPNSSTCTALETAAGGRLYNVVVDTNITCQKLLDRGNLQQRTTFIPLNKVQGQRMNDAVINLAKNMVGKENVHAALSLVEFEKKLQPAMDYIFGNVLIGLDMNVARQVTFHERIRKKCVTLDGDVTDPSGTLSGGARQKGPSILMQISEIQEYEEELHQKEMELQQIENELRQMDASQRQYTALKEQLEMNQHELNVLKRKLEQTEFYKQQEEVNNLIKEIDTLKETEKSCKDIEKKCNHKAKELEAKMNDSKGYKERQLKEAEAEMKKLKQIADKSKKEWQQREQDYETLNLEIVELKKGLEATAKQLETCEHTIEGLRQSVDGSSKSHSELKNEVKQLQEVVKREKAAIAEKNKELQIKVQKKEQIAAQNVEHELEIKKLSHDIKKLQEELRISKAIEADLTRKIKDSKYLEEGAKLPDKEGQTLESRIKQLQETKGKLGRKINTKAQSMFEQEEKQYNELKRRQYIVESDKKKLLAVIAELDEKKKSSLKLAYEQVSKDFGSIFNTLLPGAHAKLVAPQGMTILEGLEVKVSLGGVWKESLTELSGGQRSLAALSLILAMLLFKPAPLYILDEVDAALDLSHTQNIGNMLKTHFKKSQFIIVSLKDGMFNNANVLYRTKFVDGVSTVTRSTNKS